MEMANNTLSQNISQALEDFSDIKEAIIEKGVSVPSGTPTSEYGNKIREIGSGTDYKQDLIGIIERTAININLPSEIQKIGNESCYYFDSFKSIVINEGLTRIGISAFAHCYNLELTSLPDGITNIGQNAFSGCTKLALTKLPNDLTSMGLSAFAECTNLSLTNLPNGITSILSQTFRDCTNLSLTNLPNGITFIGQRAFAGCTNLSLTKLPESLMEIGDLAFMGARFPNNTVTFEGIINSISSNAFQSTQLNTINVPWGEGEVEGAPWGATGAVVNYNHE